MSTKEKNKIFCFSAIFSNTLLIILGLVVLTLSVYLLLFEDNTIERNVAIYIFLIFGILVTSLYADEKYAKKHNQKIFYRRFGIGGFIYWVFIISETLSITILSICATFFNFQPNKDSIYLALYLGILFGTAFWYGYHLFRKNADYDALHMIIQPFVLIVTMWGYMIDKFGVYKNFAIFMAFVILAFSLLVDLLAYKNKEKTVDVQVEHISTVYSVVTTNDKGVEKHYKITIKKH